MKKTIISLLLLCSALSYSEDGLKLNIDDRQFGKVKDRMWFSIKGEQAVTLFNYLKNSFENGEGVKRADSPLGEERYVGENIECEDDRFYKEFRCSMIMHTSGKFEKRSVNPYTRGTEYRKDQREAIKKYN